MRTHLLQTTTRERDDAQLDRAANDAKFGASLNETPRQVAKALALAAPAQVAPPGSPSDNDDYWLGGYAGI